MTGKPAARLERSHRRQRSAALSATYLVSREQELSIKTAEPGNRTDDSLRQTALAGVPQAHLWARSTPSR